MRAYLIILLRFGLIYSFNLRMTKSITDFQNGLNEFVDFENKSFFGFFPDKIYVGQKFKKGFFISKRGKSHSEIDGTFVPLEKYTLVKVRTTIMALSLGFLCFTFCAFTLFMILAGIHFQQPWVLVSIFILALMLSLPLFILKMQLKNTTEDIKVKLKKIVA